MRRLLLLLVIGGLAPIHTATAQDEFAIGDVILSLRPGVVQTVDTDRGGYAPYAELQAKTQLGTSPFGLAAYGGASYERHQRSFPIVCVIGPCPGEQHVQETFLDLVAGMRVGFFPQNSPVELYVGLGSHLVHRTSTSDAFDADEEAWPWIPTVEGGVDVHLPVTRRLNVGVGANGFLPVRVGDAALTGEPQVTNEDMSRVGFHVDVQYEF